MNYSLEVYPVCYVENRLEWKQVMGSLATIETQAKGDVPPEWGSEGGEMWPEWMSSAEQCKMCAC